jgi:hypothetical protein
MFYFLSLKLKFFLFLNLLIKLNHGRVKFAPVAQLDRALGYGPGGSGFKS